MRLRSQQRRDLRDRMLRGRLQGPIWPLVAWLRPNWIDEHRRDR